MQDAESVISTATNGIVDDLASEYEVKKGRIYEMLGRDCVYPKTKKLIRRIAHCDKSSDKWRVRLLKADLDAMFAEILEEAETTVNAAEIHQSRTAEQTPCFHNLYSGGTNNRRNSLSRLRFCQRWQTQFAKSTFCRS